MASIYSVKLLKNGQLIQQRQVHTALADTTGAVRLKGQPDVVYVLNAESSRKAVGQLLTKRVGNDLHVVLEGDNTEKAQLVIESFFAPLQSSALATQNSEGELVLFNASKATAPEPDSAQSEGWQTQTAPGADAAWYSGAGTQLALIAGGLLLVSAAKNSGGSDNTRAAQDSIAAYATGAAQSSTPSDSTYKDAGYSGVTPSNVGAINSVLQRTHAKDTADIQKVITTYQKLIDKANGNSPDNTTNDPTLQDYQTLGLVLLNLERSDNPNGLALLTDILKGRTLGDINTVSKLDGFAAIADKILLLAKGDTPPVALSTAELNSIGLSDVTDTHIAAIRSAIGASADDGSGVTSVAQLTAIQSAYLKVLAQADGVKSNTTEASKTPTVAELTTLGVKLGKAGNTSDAQQASALSLLNDLMDGLSNTAVDSVKEINDLASTIDKLMGIATATSADQASALGLTFSELNAWGLTGISNDNLAQVVEAVRLTQSSDGKKLNTLKQMQSAVDLGVIMHYAESSPLASSGHVAPTLGQYTSAGLLSADAGNNKALNLSNLSAVNSAVEALHASDVNSVAKLQAIVNTYAKLLALANGVKDDNSERLTLADYLSLGALTRFDSTTGAIDGTQAAKAATDNSPQKEAALNLLNSVINARSATQVDSIAEINALSAAADKLLDLTSSDTNTALKLGDFSLLGIQNVNEGNLAEVKQNLNAASVNVSSGTNIDSLEEIQSAVSLAVLELFADNAATNPLPTNQSTVTQLYKDLILPNTQITWTDALANGVSSVVNFLGKADITTIKVSEIATAYQSVLLEATGGISNNNENPLAAQYKSLLNPLNSSDLKHHVYEDTTDDKSTTSLASNALALLNDVVRQKTPNQLINYGTLEIYANTIDKLMNLAAKPNTGAPAANDIQLTIADLTSLGFNVSGSWIGTPSGTTDGFTYKVANSDDHGAAIRTWSQVQTLISQSSVF